MRITQLDKACHQFTSLIMEMGETIESLQDEVTDLKDEIQTLREELSDLRTEVALKQDCPELL